MSTIVAEASMDVSRPAGIEAVRRFNRFYTRRIGVLDEALLGSGLALAEVRVLWEIGHAPGCAASALADRLALDSGYLSRILRGFRARGWVEATASDEDARQRRLTLTAKGRRGLEPLERRSNAQVAAMLAELGPARRERLVEAMRSIQALLDPAEPVAWPYTLREPRPGDFGWVVERHGAVYAREYGWDTTFEGLVAEIVAKYLRRHDPARARAWIAEREGDRIGCVFLVGQSRRVAQLRLLFVEPSARGLGVGSQLVDECIRFARAARYGRIVLWTQSILTSARSIYARKGFRIVASEKHRSFGAELAGENWALELG
jgi:DNA-binding MarR family transcriptional regulator/N-acetylglutamate synthase-like GNAT family acetyltransferase